MFFFKPKKPIQIDDVGNLVVELLDSATSAEDLEEKRDLLINMIDEYANRIAILHSVYDNYNDKVIM